MKSYVLLALEKPDVIKKHTLTVHIWFSFPNFNTVWSLSVMSPLSRLIKLVKPNFSEDSRQKDERKGHKPQHTWSYGVELPPQSLVTVVHPDWKKTANGTREKSGFELSVQTVNLDLGFPHCLGWPQSLDPVTKPHIPRCAARKRELVVGGGWGANPREVRHLSTRGVHPGDLSGSS